MLKRIVCPLELADHSYLNFYDILCTETQADCSPDTRGAQYESKFLLASRDTTTRTQPLNGVPSNYVRSTCKHWPNYDICDQAQSTVPWNPWIKSSMDWVYSVVVLMVPLT